MNDIIDNTTTCQEAMYTQSPVPIFKDNPLIEALPPILDTKELYSKLSFTVPYENNFRNQSSMVRKECLSSLFYFFQPWGVHLEIAERIGRSIRNGYINRNPLSSDFPNVMNKLSNCVINRDSSFTNFKSTNSGALGFSIVGVSGSGKTSIVDRTLKTLYPQKILHTNYKGMDFNHLQIVWIKITCPFDGSVKGLCVKFFEEFDRITGDTTFKRFASSRASTVDTMLAQMALIARRHSLGTLVIDEIQNINMAKSGGKDRMLNFMSDLMDTLGIPIIVIGIPAAISALSGSFMTARRSTGQQGTVKMDSLRFGTDEWTLFANSMWKYQWTKVETKLTDEISEVINKLCKGIVSLAIQLYAWTQEAAIDNGHFCDDEIMTPAMFIDVANSERFCILKDQISAIDNTKDEPTTKGVNRKFTPPVSNCGTNRRSGLNKNNIDPSLDHWDKDTENIEKKLADENLILKKDEPF